mmetsp:Transcript_45725/g.115084  ORF Transcript_45725/g.115084 Transcript_45725/m.115084 type:complete len:937 (+) Transcript_45725:35-2845(+)
MNSKRAGGGRLGDIGRAAAFRLDGSANVEISKESAKMATFGSTTSPPQEHMDAIKCVRQNPRKSLHIDSPVVLDVLNLPPRRQAGSAIVRPSAALATPDSPIIGVRLSSKSGEAIPNHPLAASAQMSRPDHFVSPPGSVYGSDSEVPNAYAEVEEFNSVDCRPDPAPPAKSKIKRLKDIESMSSCSLSSLDADAAGGAYGVVDFELTTQSPSLSKPQHTPQPAPQPTTAHVDSQHSGGSEESRFFQNDLMGLSELTPQEEAELQLLGDWNERFQQIAEKLGSFRLNTPVDDRIAANNDLLELSQDFIHSAKTYGRIIISERYLSNKTIAPTQIGGCAGGEKYVVHNILFKFAVDSNGLLGSDFAAAKLAGNELRGLICFLNAGVKQLCVPIMALVDYLGFRLIAMSVLPIGRSSLVYGTRDGGQNIFAKDPTFNELMKKAAKISNIKEHVCGVEKGKGVLLHSAADIEGHIGLDKRYYLLDFSRTMPPVTPDPRFKSGHLYRLFRPEFVKAYPHPLCPDAYSGFILADPNPKKHNGEIQEATKLLTEETIPRFGKDMSWIVLEAKEKNQLANLRVSEILHSQGINIRYIGLVVQHVRVEEKFKVMKTLLIAEAIARVIKNFIRAQLRQKMKKFRQPLEAAYRNQVVSYMNLVFGSSPDSESHWNNAIKPELALRFSVGSPWTDASYNLRNVFTDLNTPDLDPRFLIFVRVRALTGLRFSQIAMQKFEKIRAASLNVYDTVQPFDGTDVEEVGERVKHMGIVNEAQGTFYYYKGLAAKARGDVAGATHFYLLSIQKYEEALNSNPNNKNILRNVGLAWSKMIELQKVGSRSTGGEGVKFNVSDPQVIETDRYFIRSIAADDRDPYTLYSYAKFLWRCSRMERAKDFFLRALSMDANYVACLRDYGHFLMEQGKADVAEKFIMTADQIEEAQRRGEPL